jgi:hypothetical protein
LLVYLRLFDGKEALTPHAGAEFRDIDEAIATARKAAKAMIACNGADARWFELSDSGGCRIASVLFEDLALHGEDAEQCEDRQDRQRPGEDPVECEGYGLEMIGMNVVLNDDLHADTHVEDRNNDESSQGR